MNRYLIAFFVPITMPFAYSYETMSLLLVVIFFWITPPSSSFSNSAKVVHSPYRTTFRRYAESENVRNSVINNEEDPRVFQKRIRQEQLNQILKSKTKDEYKEQSSVVPRSSAKKEIIKKRRQGEAASAAMDLPVQPMVTTIGGGTNTLFESIRNAVVPRWHPVPGVADINPQFRVESPTMNSNGYAATIWRNARKRQPAMWRYALRTFDRMVQQQQEQQLKGPKIDIINTHYEGALVAASKLGWSQRALEIYETVEKKEDQILERIQQSSMGSSATKSTGGSGQNTKIAIRITENMVFSVIRASVRESMQQRRREPLDAVLNRVINNMYEKHGISVTSIHLNPIAAGYQSLGYTNVANELLLGNLLDRIGEPEAENAIDTTFNVYDVQAKDKGSYSLLVQSAVQEQDWGQAVRALKTMTEAGLYPTNRHINLWTEVSGKRSTQRQLRVVNDTATTNVVKTKK
jgi:hypothetical protein